VLGCEGSSTTRLSPLTIRKGNAYARLAPKHTLSGVDLLDETVAKSSTDRELARTHLDPFGRKLIMSFPGNTVR
jgi:hypothetical protein